MPEWFSQNIGTVLTVGGSVLVAIIMGIFGLWAKHHSPRQPVPIQDVWSENRSLRADLRDVEERLDEIDRNYRKTHDGLSVLWRYVERIKNAWGVQTVMPTLTPAERRTLSAVIEDMDTPATGTSVAANP